MKLTHVHFIPDRRIKEIGTALITDERHDLVEEGPWISVTRRSDGERWRVPVLNILWTKAAIEEKAAKK